MSLILFSFIKQNLAMCQFPIHSVLLFTLWNPWNLDNSSAKFPVVFFFLLQTSHSYEKWDLKNKSVMFMVRTRSQAPLSPPPTHIHLVWIIKYYYLLVLSLLSTSMRWGHVLPCLRKMKSQNIFHHRIFTIKKCNFMIIQISYIP